MKSQVVVVKDFRVTLLKRVAVHATEAMVYVTSEKESEKMKNGQPGLFPIGFRRENVFEYRGDPMKKNLRPWGGQAFA
jgi:hypothetical protein